MEYSKEVVEMAENFGMETELKAGEFDFILNSDLTDVEFCMENYLELDAIKAYYKNFRTLDNFDENYLGEYDNDKDFMENNNYFGFLDGIDSNIINYIDYEKLTNDLMMDFVEVNRFYFHNN